MKLQSFISGWFFILTLLISANYAQSEETDSAEANIRATINLSLPFIEEKGEWWIEKKKCVTCHRISMMTWSFAEANRRGFDIDQDKLNEWIDWSLSKSLEQEEHKGVATGSKNLEGLAQLLLGSKSTRQSVDQKKSFSILIQLLVEAQTKEGSWEPGGQLPRQKRPSKETTEVSTMWNALALSQINTPTDASKSAVFLAKTHLTKAAPGKSTEWYVTQLLLASSTGETVQQFSWQNKILSGQNEDGGWGWIMGEPSDTLATGLALYALATTDIPIDDPALISARNYLINTQREDGSWAVFGTKEHKKEKLEETAIYWGTTWATLGLLQTLPLSE